jgi:membrane-associated phospholipid phosphatase
MLQPRQALRRHRRVHWVVVQTSLVLAAVFCYFQARGLTHADPVTAFGNARLVMEFEGWLGLGLEVDVQRAIIAHDTAYNVANWVYVWGHWPVIIAVMVWTVLHHRHAFLRLRDAMLVSGALGLVVFVTFPVAPPRLVDPAMVDTVTARSEAYRYLQPPNFTNQYAAMPSLHAGWDLLVGITLITVGGTLALRLLGWVLPALMALAVVATANHYFIDVAAGVALALIGHLVALQLEKRRTARARPTESAADRTPVRERQAA